MNKNFLVAKKYIKNACVFIFYVQRLSYHSRDKAQDKYLKENYMGLWKDQNIKNKSCKLRKKNNQSTQKHRICKLQTTLNLFSHQG